MKYIAQFTPPLYTVCPVLPFSTVHVVTHMKPVLFIWWSRWAVGGSNLNPASPLLLLLHGVLGKQQRKKRKREGRGTMRLTPWILAKLIVSHPRCAQVFVFVCFQSHELFVCLMLSLFIACLYGSNLLLCLTYQHLFSRQTERVRKEWKRVSLIVHLSCLVSFWRSDLACIEYI